MQYAIWTDYDRAGVYSENVVCILDVVNGSVYGNKGHLYEIGSNEYLGDITIDNPIDTTGVILYNSRAELLNVLAGRTPTAPTNGHTLNLRLATILILLIIIAIIFFWITQGQPRYDNGSYWPLNPLG